MRPHASKLIEVVEQNAKAIAQQWYKNIKINPKTPAYHTMPEEKAMEQALSFYDNFRKLFATEKPFEDAFTLFSSTPMPATGTTFPCHGSSTRSS